MLLSNYLSNTEFRNTVMLLVILILALIIVLVIKKIFKTPAKRVYTYIAKDCIMTNRECKFFRILLNLFEDDYLIFPQQHLSSLMTPDMNGTGYGGAFLHINGKSVDFVICDRNNFKPLCAIELDDRTHDRQDRIERDREVESIFRSIGLPLVRFREIPKSHKEIELNISKYL